MDPPQVDFFEISLKVLAVFSLVLLNGFFVAAEFAIVKVRSTQIIPLARKNNRRAKIAENIIKNLDSYLSATQLGITLTSLGLGWLGWVWLGEYDHLLAHEAGKSGKFDSLHSKALTLFAEARKLGPARSAVAAVVGGTYALFADRLPEKHRPTAWADSYTSYKVLWSQQSQVLEKLPLHTRGELLAGLAQSSQRTGRSKELDIYLDKILTLLPDTRYARVAKSWKEDPEFAARSNISCKYCHKPGRLSAKLAALKGK